MKLKLTVLLFSIVFAYTFSIAQHGGLDNTFGNNGIVTTSSIGAADLCRDIAVQSDNKILLVGSRNNGTDLDFILVRYHSNGALDSSFGDNGIVSTNLGADEAGMSVAVLPDGKILAAGTQGTAFSNFLMFKFNNNGTLDMTFGTNGRVSTDFNGGEDIPNNILLTEDGKIILTGQAAMEANKEYAAARYNSDGTLDASFSDDGKATFDFVDADNCNSSVLQQDGKIILFGYISLAGDTDFAMVRVTEGGNRDLGFGSSGKVITDFGTNSDYGFSVALQQDGKIVAAGYTGDVQEQESKLGVACYNADGSLDNTFGDDGLVSSIVTLGTDGYHDPNYATIQTDGKILIAGTSQKQGNGSDINLVRLNPDGSFDNTFGSNGIVATDIGTLSNMSRGIVLQSDQKILVAGNVFTNPGADISVTRYLSGFGLGVVDFSIQADEIIIYPNPIRESAVLEYTLINNETINIDLYNISGRLVQSFVRSERRMKGDHKESLAINASIPSGSYILTLSNGKGSSSVRLVK